MLRQQQAIKLTEQDGTMEGVSEIIRIGTIEQKAAHEKLEDSMSAQIVKMDQADAAMRNHIDTMIAHNAKSAGDEQTAAVADILERMDGLTA